MTIEYISLNKTQARRMSMNPVFKYSIPPLVLMGQVIMKGEKRFEMPVCETCDVVDENMDNSPQDFPDAIFTNGNMLIEYPKRSMQFHCPCCFQNNMSDKVVARVMGEEWVMTPKERGE